MAKYDKIIRFDTFCKTCKHKDKAEVEDPCWDCLSVPATDTTRKPIKYEEAEE